MLTKEQQRVHEWLDQKLALPVFAGAYKGAVIFLNEKPPGYVTFVAHAGRDLMNRLASTVAGIESGRVQYQQRLDCLQKDWKGEWGAKGISNSGATDSGHLIPFKTCQQIKDLIDEHKTGRLRSSDSDGLFFSTFLDYKDKDRIPRNFLADWKKAKDWFLSYAHIRKDPFDIDIASETIQNFQLLDGFLYVAASSVYERIRGINEILEETNG